METKPEPEPAKELSKEVRQALALCRQFPAEFNQACAELKINFSVNDFDDQIAIKVCKMVGQILDSENS